MKYPRRRVACESRHPEVYTFSFELANEIYKRRTPGLRQKSRGFLGRMRFVDFAVPPLVRGLREGTFEQLSGRDFPGPVTEDTIRCFEAVMRTRLHELLKAEESDHLK